ncbi:MAG: hypothetical protein HY721_27660 [Planctomycetes bacterium]|nr:hypothetical protein [Planctomycetota bacterium]
MVALVGTAGSGHGQIFTENAGVISPETPIVRESVSALWAKHLREVRWTNQFLWGVTPKLELNLALPVVYRHTDFRVLGEGKEHHDDFGLGDAVVRGKASLYQVDEVLTSTRWAALGEVVAPTGDDDETDGGVRLPRRLQLGPGAWGFGAGSAFTVIRDRHRCSVEAFYRHHLGHDGVELGDEMRWNLAYWYRLYPPEFSAEKQQVEVRPVVELLSTYRFEDRGGAVTKDGEGFLMWLAPGLQVYPSRRVLLEASVSVPVLQTVDDNIGRRLVGLFFAVKFLF